jgi:site-specific DNA-methyltransferase (cytosine-N4-specific)
VKNLELFDKKPKVFSTYTHSFFPYPAKFPPEPIRTFLHKYSGKGDVVLDPFCGSGTVLVEALLAGRRAHGIELNPVAALVSKAKATVYRDEHVQEARQFLRDIATVEQLRDSWIKDTVQLNDVPSYKNIDLWFEPNMLQELTALRKTFLIEGKYSSETKMLLWMAFLKIIVPVSNQDGETRYASIKKPELVDGYAISKLRETVQAYIRAIEISSLEDIDSSWVRVDKNDAVDGLSIIEDNSIDLAITSPPYINTFDYYLYHKHRIFWMNENPQEIRKREIGCHHRIDTMTFTKALDEYRTYMLNVLSKVYAKLRGGKRFVMLIGDGIVKDEVIYADKLIADLAAKTGFIVEDINTMKLREVSRGFIKGKTLDRKNHHAIILVK